MDNELILFDRLNIIRDVIQNYGEDKFYISFSGGKDSTVLHHLVDEALPDNKIPRVFCDTGIEYDLIRTFVHDMEEKDERLVIINPSKNIKKVLEEYGYPFKSKEFSHILAVYQRSGMLPSVEHYMDDKKGKFKCPKRLKYQFSENYGIKTSDQCCYKLKKEPFKKYEKESQRIIAMTGMMATEKGLRESIHSCIISDKEGKLKKFHPLLKVSSEWEEWYIKQRNIKLCELYYPPYSFQRTGCKGCPYSLHLQEQLEVMSRLMPNERKQCEIIWKPVYEEYRRTGYRLKKSEQVKLF